MSAIRIICCLSVFGACHPLHAGADRVPPTDRTLEQVLRDAGENRPELEEALQRMPGEDTEFLLRNASQSDLVNLTADFLVENVRLAREVRDVPWRPGDRDEERWREWVLPYRVLEEDLDPWRGRLHAELWPLVSGAGSTAEAAGRVLEWLWAVEEDGDRKIRFGTSESRNKSPSQILASGVGACRELNLIYVVCLRSVGIPARHCTVGWWYGKSSRHFFSEYWDPDRGGWAAWDSSDNLAGRSESPRARFANGKWMSLRCYAHPGLSPECDLYDTFRWERLEPIADALGDTLNFAVDWPEADDFKVSLHVWNMRTWRLAAEARSEEAEGGGGVASFDLIRTQSLDEPVLLVATSGEEIRWQFVDLEENDGGLVRVEGKDIDKEKKPSRKKLNVRQ